MTDQIIRSLERSNKSSLIWRLRTAQISESAVKSAASLGDPEALSIYPDTPQIDWTSHKDRLSLFKSQSHSFCVRAAVSFARHVLPIFESAHPEDSRPRAAIEAAEKWLADPTEDNRLASADAVHAAAYAADAAHAAAYVAHAANTAAYAAHAAHVADHVAADADAYADAAHAAADAAINAAGAAGDYDWQPQIIVDLLLDAERYQHHHVRATGKARGINPPP